MSLRAILAPVFALSILTAPMAAESDHAPQQTLLPPRASTRHVVLVSIDGLRPDAIDHYGAPTLQRLAREGSYTYSARTILPSKTLPSHTSMLTGMQPDQHGVNWNTAFTARMEEVGVPTVFGLAHAKGLVTAAFFSKSKFHPLQKRGTLDYTQAPRGWFGRWKAERTVRDVETYLRRATPNLLFIHLADPDRAGHDKGWMTDAYGQAVLAADAAVARIVSASSAAFGAGEFTLIVTADHGGHDRDHGSDDPRDVIIPWIAWGEGVHRGPLAATRTVTTTDTASTVLRLLGLREPAGWSAPVAGAFVNATW